MKKCKRLMCFVLAVLMIFSINVPAFALETQENGNSAKDDGTPFTIEVTTNKSEYSTLGVAKIDVTITNTSSEEIQNVSAEAVFKQLAPAGRKSETKKEVDTLKAGESISFAYKATINKEEYNLNIFEKIFLWLVRLFNGGFSASDNGFDDGRECTENVTTIKFGKFNADSIIRVWYGKENENNEWNEWINISENVGNNIKELHKRDDYINLSKQEKVELTRELLNELERQGLIRNIIYEEPACMFHFEYYNGLSSGTVVEGQRKDGYWSNSQNPTNNVNRKLDIKNSSFVTSNKSTISTNQKWKFIYGASKDMLSYTHMQELHNIYDNMNIEVEINHEATVETYKNLGDSTLIYIMAHGSFSPYIITTEKVTSEKNKNSYKDELKNKDLERIESDGEEYYWIKPSFFKSVYQEHKLNNPIVLLSCCCAFGNENIENYEFSDNFREAGANSVIGFCNSVNEVYSAAFFSKVLSYLTEGYTIKQSFDNSKSDIGNNENEFFNTYYAKKVESDNSAYPILSSKYDNNKLFNENLDDLGSYTATVKDKISNEAINNVGVLISDKKHYENKKMGYFFCCKTDKNGVFTADLPQGKYVCELINNKYETAILNIVIDKNIDTVRFDPILLTPKNTNIPSTAVEFNGHYYQVYDESMTWTEAKKYCESLGGHLATITSQEEQQFIESQLVNGQKSCYWLGGTDSAVEGKWNWITGEEFSYTKWGADMPDNWQDEDYLMIYKDPHPSHTGNTFGFWNDLKENGTCQGTSYFKKEVFGFVCEWDEFTHETPTASNCITKRECVDYGWYTGNMGDSCLFSLDKQGIYNDNADNSGYYRNGNIGLDGTEYNNGFEAWIARWNPTAEISWAYATYKLEGKYKKLTGKTSLIQSANTNNFNTTVYFYNGDTLLQSYVLKNDDYEKDIDVDVTGVDELKILVKDNVAVKGGTSFALYDMFLN